MLRGIASQNNRNEVLQCLPPALCSPNRHAPRLLHRPFPSSGQGRQLEEPGAALAPQAASVLGLALSGSTSSARSFAHLGSAVLFQGLDLDKGRLYIVV